MKLSEVVEFLNAKVVCGHDNLSREVYRAFASDLMSDVLTINTQNLLLLTGLTNIQTIRTSEMADVLNIVIVRNKKATAEMIEIAKEMGMVILECDYSMYKACGILFSKGLNPVY